VLIVSSVNARAMVKEKFSYGNVICDGSLVERRLTTGVVRVELADEKTLTNCIKKLRNFVEFNTILKKVSG